MSSASAAIRSPSLIIKNITANDIPAGDAAMLSIANDEGARPRQIFHRLQDTFAAKLPV